MSRKSMSMASKGQGLRALSGRSARLGMLVALGALGVCPLALAAEPITVPAPAPAASQAPEAPEATAAPATPAASPSPALGAGPNAFKLPGGLEVLTHEDHAQPSVTIDTWIGAGSAQDFPGYSGIAAATASALYEGGTPSLKDALAALGGQSELTVLREASHLRAQVPANQLNAALDAIGGAFARPEAAFVDLKLLRPTWAARATQATGTPDAYADARFRQALLGPELGHPVWGQPESLAALTGPDLAAFAGRYYVPSRMHVVLVGDFATGPSVGAVVRGYAGVLKRQEATGAPMARPMAPTAEVKPAELGTVVMAGARAPGFQDENQLAVFEVLASALEGRLRAALVPALAKDLAVSFEPGRGPGALSVRIRTEPGQVPAVERALRDAIAQLRQAPLSLNEQARVVNALVAASEAQQASQAGKAAALGLYATLGPDYRWALSHADALRQVSRQEVQAAAQAYLPPDALKLLVLQP